MGEGSLTTFYLPSTYGIFHFYPFPPTWLHPPPPDHLASVSLNACIPLAYVSPSSWNAFSPLGYLFKSNLESAFGGQMETSANPSQSLVCLLSEASS